MKQKILFFKLGAIGDALMSTPLLRQVRKNRPKAQMDFLIGKHSSALLEENKNLDKVILFDEDVFTKKRIWKYVQLIRDVRKRKYDCIFVLDKHRIFNLTARLFGIKQRIGFDRKGKEGAFLTKKVYYDNSKHEIYYYLDMAKAAGMTADSRDNQLEISISNQDKDFAQRIMKKMRLTNFLVLVNSGGNNPGEKSKVRKLPDHLFKELVKELSKKHKLVFMGSNAEARYYNRFMLNKNCYNLTGKTNLKQSAAIMAKAKKIITTDCGPMHVAAAVNKNVISLFGPTDPMRKAPLHKGSKAIWKDKKIYQPDYELYGKSPQGPFFKDMAVSDIIKDI